MASRNRLRLSVFAFLFFVCLNEAKLSENETAESKPEIKTQKNDGAALLFADELKQTIEKYMFGMCPQSFKAQLGNKGRNMSTPVCDLDVDQQDLTGRLATLALRAHSASRSDCSRLSIALANTFGELARTSANKQALTAATNEANKKRKLSKSQKAKIQAKQRTALAVKKKAAAAAAAAAAKMSA